MDGTVYVHENNLGTSNTVHTYLIKIMSWIYARIYGCVVHCYKEDVRNEALEDQITVIILGSVHSTCILQMYLSYVMIL